MRFIHSPQFLYTFIKFPEGKPYFRFEHRDTTTAVNVLMDEDSFKKLMKEDLYQVFLLSSPASIPINLGIHPWFVINRKGTISKWEVGFGLQHRNKSWGHLDLDLLPPHQGVRMFAFSNAFWWRSKLIGSIEGDEHSLAARMAEFIAESQKTYPYQQKYSLLGPNSNTYAQWVLNHFPESGMKLPWRAFGKNTKVVDKI